MNRPHRRQKDRRNNVPTQPQPRPTARHRAGAIAEPLECRNLLSAAAVHPDTGGSLAAYVAHTTIPASIVAGRAFGGIAIVDVLNQTDRTTISGSATIQVFASADGMVDDSSILLATTKHHVNLKPGFSAFVDLRINAARDELPAASYTLLAEVTDPTGVSSSATSGPGFQVAAPFVSLQNLTLGKVAPAKIKLGRGGTIALTLANAGNVATSGKASISLYLSTGGQPDSSPFATLNPVLKIGPGRHEVFHLHFVVPSTLQAGSYLLFVAVADDGGSVSGLASQSVTLVM